MAILGIDRITYGVEDPASRRRFFLDWGLKQVRDEAGASAALDFETLNGCEVFGGGLHISRWGWETEIGPGRHPISSAYFWYVKNPAGALAEYYTDEDQLDGAWEPRDFQPSPEMFAERAVIGGIDGTSRRVKAAHE